MAGGENKTIWVIGNWKSNKSIKEALDWISEIGPKLEEKDNVKVVICCSFTLLSEVKKAVTVGSFPIMVGSQDLSPFGSGAFTGEVSAEQLKELAFLSIIGHSERRQNFNETDDLVAKKSQQAVSQGLIPMVCVQDETIPVPEGVKLIAFEPPNAISTSGPNAKADDPENAVVAAKAFKEKYGQDLEVIYGGSVNEVNAKAYLERPEISGVLPGAASLDPEKFLKIVEIAQSI